MQDDVINQRMLIFTVVLCAFIGLMIGLSVWQGVGVSIAAQDCAWDETLQQYVIQSDIRNKESAYKLVDLKVQIRLQPQAHQKWINGAVKAKYESVSQFSQIYLENQGSDRPVFYFDIPGISEFRCRAKVSAIGQTRFEEPPSQDILESLQQQVPAAEGSTRRPSRLRLQ